MAAVDASGENALPGSLSLRPAYGERICPPNLNLDPNLAEPSLARSSPFLPEGEKLSWSFSPWGKLSTRNESAKGARV